MKYIICYDIKEDRIRQRVVKLLESKAHRMQYSVFIGEFDDAGCKIVQSELLATVADADRPLLLMVPMCAACESKAWTVGEPREPFEPACIIV